MYLTHRRGPIDTTTPGQSGARSNGLVWFGFFGLWHINHRGLFNVKIYPFKRTVALQSNL